MLYLQVFCCSGSTVRQAADRTSLGQSSSERPGHSAPFAATPCLPLSILRAQAARPRPPSSGSRLQTSRPPIFVSRPVAPLQTASRKPKANDEKVLSSADDEAVDATLTAIWATVPVSAQPAPAPAVSLVWLYGLESGCIRPQSLAGCICPRVWLAAYALEPGCTCPQVWLSILIGHRFPVWLTILRSGCQLLSAQGA